MVRRANLVQPTRKLIGDADIVRHYATAFDAGITTDNPAIRRIERSINRRVFASGSVLSRTGGEAW